MRRAIIWLVLLAVAAAAIWWTQVRPQTRQASVFFVGAADGSGTIVPVNRLVEGRGEAALSGALQALLAGPTEADRAMGLSTEIPSGTRLLSVHVADGIATVDLSGAFGSGGGSSSMQGRLWQVVYTATGMPGVRRVRLLLDGQERQALGGEGLLIDRPIGRPPAFPRF